MYLHGIALALGTNKRHLLSVLEGSTKQPVAEMYSTVHVEIQETLEAVYDALYMVYSVFLIASNLEHLNCYFGPLQSEQITTAGVM